MRRTLAAVLGGGAALVGTALPAAGITDPVGDPITSEVRPAAPSARPFADIVELDGAMYGSTLEVRVRVAGSGQPPAPFSATFVTGEVGSPYPGMYISISHGSGPTSYRVYEHRSSSTRCEGAASFDGASTYTARVDMACIGSPHPIDLGVTTSVDDPTPQGDTQWQDQAFDAVVHPSAVQAELRPSWTAAGATYAGARRLSAGETLRQGQYLLSEDAGTALVLLRNGNLVLHGPGGLRRWSSGTGGQGVVRASMQSDGNFVLYTSDGRAVWSTGTYGNAFAGLTVQNDGNAVIYGARLGEALWSTQTSSPAALVPLRTDRLLPGGRIRPGQYLRSADRRFVLALRPDGDLVAYGPGHHALWTSGTRGQPIHHAAFQRDGNLVLYRTDGRPAWSSGTAGQPGRRLVVQSDGNVVLYGPASRPLWWSGTEGRV